MSHQTLQHLLPQVGAFAAPTKASIARTFAVQALPRVGKTASSREPLSTDSSLFLLTERGLNEDFLTSVCEHCEILGWFAPDVHIDLNNDLLSLSTLQGIKLKASC
jgi:hypothetical protein